MKIFQYLLLFTLYLDFFSIKIWPVFSDIAKFLTSHQKEIPVISQRRSDLLSIRNYIYNHKVCTINIGHFVN